MAARLAAILIGVTGCAEPSMYGRAGPDRQGYTVRRLSADHYNVTFTGAANVGLNEVKGRLRRRVAEVTLSAGYSHFVIYTSSAEAEIASSIDDFWNAENGYLSGTVRRTGTSFASPATGQASYQGAGQANPRTRYTASSEIIVLKGDAAARNPDALSAREILDLDAASPRP